jgi:hypothetical protein
VFHGHALKAYQVVSSHDDPRTFLFPGRIPAKYLTAVNFKEYADCRNEPTDVHNRGSGRKGRNLASDFASMDRGEEIPASEADARRRQKQAAVG